MTKLDLSKLSAEELTALAREATAKAKEARSKAAVQLDALLVSTRENVKADLVAFQAVRSFFPGTILVRIDEAGAVMAKWQRGRRVTRRHRVPRPPLVYAYYAVSRKKLTVRQALSSIEDAFGQPWPGETPAARRNSLKAALARIRPAEKAVVKLKTPRAIREWALAQSGKGYEKAAEAMIALSAA